VTLFTYRWLEAAVTDALLGMLVCLLCMVALTLRPTATAVVVVARTLIHVFVEAPQ
jgi:hypothetical protein